MKKVKRFRKIFYLLSLALLILSLAYFNFKPNIRMARAQSGATTTAPIDYQKDSDYDGLSDWEEINVYHTNPLKADTDGDGYLDSTEILIGSDPLNPRDPGDSLTRTIAGTSANSTVSSVPWYVTRAAGLVAYGLMFLVVMLGIGMTAGYIYKYINPVKAWVVHKYLALALGIALLTHIIALSLDKFVNFKWAEILIPFYSTYKPLYLSLGILGLYILLIIIFTSLFFRLKYKRTWRGIHYAVYFLFTLSLIHGLFIGTDSKTIIMQIIYWATGLIFFSLVIYRFLLRYIKKGSKKVALAQ